MRAGAVLLVVLAAAACTGGQAASAAPAAPPKPPTQTPTPQVLTAIAPPDCFSDAGGSWLHVRDGNLSILVGVQAPAGSGPFPTVVYVPGEVGLEAGDVRWAARLAQAGYLVVLGCTVASDPPPACHQPDPPSFSGLDDLVAAAALLPQARRGGVGVVGVSAGAAVPLAAAGRRTDLAAVVADSPGRPCQQPSRAPVLLLAGTTDGAYDSAVGCARLMGGAAEAQYFTPGGHVVTRTAGSADAATARAIAFLDQHLR